MRVIIKAAALVAFVLCGAWGSTGHKVIAKIAYDRLTPKAKGEVEKLLSGTTLADFSVWADQIKDERTWSHTKPWHFADMPADAKEFKLERDCPTEGCVVQAIQKYSGVLSSAGATKEEKVQALKFLVHFVGDVHQPLHVGNKEDKGGTQIKVSLFRREMNLHAVWDDAIIKRTGREYTSYASYLQERVTPELEKAMVASMDPVQWATESNQVAKAVAYRVPGGAAVQAGDTLGDEYSDAAQAAIEQQMTRAGVRLATLLNTIYEAPPKKLAPAKKPATPPAPKKQK